MLMKIRHFVPKRELTSIYSALFLSHLTYGSQIWGQSKTIYTEKAFRLQNRAQRIIDFADFRAEVKPIYKRNKMPNLEDQIKVQNCLFVFDYFKGSLPRSFNGYFTIVCTKIIGLEFCNGHNFVIFCLILLIFSNVVDIKKHFDII